MSAGSKRKRQPSSSSIALSHSVGSGTAAWSSASDANVRPSPEVEVGPLGQLGRRVLDDDGADEVRVAGGELVRVHAAERVAEHDGRGEPERLDHARRVGHIALAAVVIRARRPPVPALVGGDDAPRRGQPLRKPRPRPAAAEVAVEGEQRRTLAAVAVGQVAAREREPVEGRERAAHRCAAAGPAASAAAAAGTAAGMPRSSASSTASAASSRARSWSPWAARKSA
jgi:hypothetical protein